jgi:thymidylate kinase
MSNGSLIAIVGSDGSGKSTVGEALLEWLQERGPAELCHLGKQSGNLGRRLARLPLFGRGVDRTIHRQIEVAGSRKGPNHLAAIVIFSFSLRRIRRFRRMLALRERGVTILADRFPQTSVLDGLDGPGFGKVRHDRGLARQFAAREIRQFEWMTSHTPDLVIRLNVDAATAIARKPDHQPEALRSKIAGVPKLTYNGAPIIDIDATQPLLTVIDHAKRAIAEVLNRSVSTRWPASDPVLSSKP